MAVVVVVVVIDVVFVVVVVLNVDLFKDIAQLGGREKMKRFLTNVGEGGSQKYIVNDLLLNLTQPIPNHLWKMLTLIL